MPVKWYGGKILQEIRDATPDGLFVGGQMLVDAASDRAPHVTGTLQESRYVATEEKSTYRADKQHQKEVKPPKGGAVAGFAAFYAGFVEYGTANRTAKPFLRPALDELKDRLGSEISAKMSRKFTR